VSWDDSSHKNNADISREFGFLAHCMHKDTLSLAVFTHKTGTERTFFRRKQKLVSALHFYYNAYTGEDSEFDIKDHY
jgi:hypothetical protein